MNDLPRYIVGNWKMNGAPGLARRLASSIPACTPWGKVTVVICPPFPFIAEAADAIRGSSVTIGGQDCHAEEKGAFTGDVSAGMLQSLGCTHVILGHSERRLGHGETSHEVCAKAGRAIAAGLIPIICVGETREIRASGRAEAVVGEQVRTSCPKGKFILAYEPVWAIGSGQTPSLEDIRSMHTHLRALVPGTKVIYGGSVNPDNAEEILGVDGVAGVLVGGASLKADEFCKIIDTATKV